MKLRLLGKNIPVNMRLKSIVFLKKTKRFTLIVTPTEEPVMSLCEINPIASK
jgi:hypothetical protein